MRHIEFFQVCDLFRMKRNIHTPNSGLNAVVVGKVDDRCRNSRFGQKPGKRYLDQGNAAPFGNFLNPIYNSFVNIIRSSIFDLYLEIVDCAIMLLIPGVGALP